MPYYKQVVHQTSMYRSLRDLQQSVNRLIEQQGENAPCAAFIFTKEDVIDALVDMNSKLGGEEVIDDILSDMGDSHYIYDQIDEVMSNSIKDRERQVQIAN